MSYQAVARYLLNAASSGQVPSTVVDDTGNGNTLSIYYSGADANWTSNVAGNGLDFVATAQTNDSAKAELANLASNGTIGAAFTDASILSGCAVLDLRASHSWGMRILALGTNSGNGDFALTHSDQTFDIRWDMESGGDNTLSVEFPSLLGEGPTVVVWEIDTTQAVAADRVKVWYNGVQQSAVADSAPHVAQNSTISLAQSDRKIVLGNRGDTTRNIDGAIYYLEFGTGLFTAQQRTDINTNLVASNDADPLIPPPPQLSITDITDPITTSAAITLTGTEFGANQGSGSVTQGGVTLPVTAWSDTSVSLLSASVESTALKYGTHAFELTTDGGSTDTITADVQPIAAHSYVDLISVAASGERVTTTPDLATGDQIRHQNVLYDGATPTAYTVTVHNDGRYTVGGGPIPDGTYDFEIRVWDSADNTWGSAGTQTVVISAVADTEKPVITLNGDATVTVGEGTSYTELGATWTDNVDGTGAAVVGGDTVNPNVIGTYNITYDYTDNAGNAADQVMRTVNVVAVNVPVIALQGASTIELEVGNTWSDPGYAASDVEDGSLTNDVVVGGDVVDINTVGTYVITYDVSDSDGHAATQVSRTVNVVDNTPPAITLNGPETVNVTVNTSYTEEGATASDNYDGDLTPSISIGGDTVDIATEGTYVITYDVVDAGGNSAPQVTRTVKVIPLPPVLPTPSVIIKSKGLTLSLSL